MKIFYLILFFILGTFFGSFFTVVGLRLPKHIDFIKKRSHCDSCDHELSMLDMVPILSYLFLKGKCRYCGEKVSNISTYMELFTGILFALSYYIFGFSFELFFALGIVAMLIILSVSDITYLIIPDEVLIFFSGYFIILTTIQRGVVTAIIGILSGLCLFLFMYLIMMLGNHFFKKESLGGGDIKLMFVIGLVVSPLLGVFLIFIASFLALPVSLLILWRKNQNLVPFGPFLLISFALIYFTGIDTSIILSWLQSI